MSLNATPSGERVHIGFFGLRNVGKSSLVNAVTGQDLAVVSDVEGTTTDPVLKAMELLPIGPVVIIDTPGADDTGKLGELRVKKTMQALRKCDIAVLVTEAGRALQPTEEELLALFKAKALPYVIVYNKMDCLTPEEQNAKQLSCREIYTSATQNTNIYELKERIAHSAKPSNVPKTLAADLLSEGDTAILVIPLDGSAPKGRLILPQQMVMRDLLDAHRTFSVCQPGELAGLLSSLREPPKIVITDSQVFSEVASIVPGDIWLTSFSILMARYKGELDPFVKGASQLTKLRDSSTVLISEGCTHHRQCEDIGTVKIPAWIRAYSNARINFVFTSGGEFPEDLGGIDLIVHCGGCMLNEKEMSYRMSTSGYADVPIVNYGMLIAQIHGILDRSLQPFLSEEAS